MCLSSNWDLISEFAQTSWVVSSSLNNAYPTCFVSLFHTVWAYSHLKNKWKTYSKIPIWHIGHSSWILRRCMTSRVSSFPWRSRNINTRLVSGIRYFHRWVNYHLIKSTLFRIWYTDSVMYTPVSVYRHRRSSLDSVNDISCSSGSNITSDSAASFKEIFNFDTHLPQVVSTAKSRCQLSRTSILSGRTVELQTLWPRLIPS